MHDEDGDYLIAEESLVEYRLKRSSSDDEEPFVEIASESETESVDIISISSSETIPLIPSKVRLNKTSSSSSDSDSDDSSSIDYAKIPGVAFVARKSFFLKGYVNADSLGLTSSDEDESKQA